MNWVSLDIILGKPVIFNKNYLTSQHFRISHTFTHMLDPLLTSTSEQSAAQTMATTLAYNPIALLTQGKRTSGAFKATEEGISWQGQSGKVGVLSLCGDLVMLSMSLEMRMNTQVGVVQAPPSWCQSLVRSSTITPPLSFPAKLGPICV